MIRHLLSRSQHHEWEIPKWFFDAEHYITRGEHCEAYQQNTYIGGNCKALEYEFEADYSGLKAKTKPNKYRNLNYNYKGTQTYCNYTVATICDYAGRKDIGKIFKHTVNDAIELMKKEANRVYSGIKLLNNPPIPWKDNYSVIYEKVYYIAMQFNSSGHGHTAVPIGVDKQGILHVFNRGAKFRHDVVPIAGKNQETAFYGHIKDLLFFEVRR